jgi:hypothetical protein
MDSIKDTSSIELFPFESLRRFRNLVSPDIDSNSQFAARSYDNRGRVSDMAGALRSRLGSLRTRLSSSSFLSDTFSWQVRTALTSDPDKLLAKAASAAFEKTYSLEVDHLATAKTAVSDRLVTDERTDFDEGTYTFDVTVDDDTYSVELVIEKSGGVLPTNRALLLDIERSINNLGLDITATLHDISQRDYNPYRENAFKEMAYVSIAADDTGESIDFSISDTSGTLIETLNLDHLRQQGSKNAYRLDGAQTASDDNEIVVESGKVNAYLSGTTGTGENLQIAVKKGVDALSSQLTQIIEAYNELINWIDDNDHIISPALKTALFKELDSIALGNMTLRQEEITTNSLRISGFGTRVILEDENSVDSDLKDIGLTLNSDGTLTVGEDFSSFIASDLRGVYDTLAGTSGFFTAVAQAIDDIHGKNESGFVYSKNSILSYSTNGSTSRSIYKGNLSSIINLFA